MFISSRLGCTTLALGGKFAEKLHAMKLAGFVATEMFPRDLHEDPRGPDYAIDALRDSGLEVSAYQALRDYEGMPAEHRSRVLGFAEQMMDQMAWIGADLLVLCSNTHPDASPDRARCLDDLAQLAELARSRGMRVAYEPIGWGQWFSDYRDAWSLVREVNHPNLGVLLDSFHIASKDLPLDGIDAIDPAKIFLVELSDLPRTQLPLFEVARHYRLFPGEGIAPIREFITRLERIGYMGRYSVEVINDHYLHSDPVMVAHRAWSAVMKVASVIDVPCSD